MTSPLTTTAARRTLDWTTGNSTTAPVLPLKAALVTALGTEAVAGTEATGGSYARQTVTFSAADSSRRSTNTALVRWSGLAAGTYQGVEIWDSAGTPIRWWHGAFSSPRTVNAGDAIEQLVGELALLA